VREDLCPTPCIENPPDLVAWMDAQGLPGTGEPLIQKYVSGGAQNEIYELRRGEFRCAMRIPPASAPEDRDAGMVREWQIISALDGTDVPHTQAIRLCADPAVLGRPFYLMAFVDGWSPLHSGGRWPEPFQSDIDAKCGLAYEVVDALARLGAVDWRARGLGELGRPEGFHERQVDRWSTLFERIKGRDLPGIELASEWLRSHKPIDFHPGLMHGDYQFANVMFDHGLPARLAAIVDWEMGTIGDPKLDLGWLLHEWPTDATSDTSESWVDLSGMPFRQELMVRYSLASGRQVDDMDYYFVLAKWKQGIILERGYQRARSNPTLLAFGPIVLKLMRDAAELAETSSYNG
jgi:aminoglycoside phosphotransferase (APT) family kinase protein